MAKTSVLVVEDNLEDAEEVLRELRKSGAFEPVHVRTLNQARTALGIREFGALVIDYRLPDGSGIRLSREARSKGFAAPIIMVTSVAQEAVAQEALDSKVDDLLIKSESFGTQVVEALNARRG